MAWSIILSEFRFIHVFIQWYSTILWLADFLFESMFISCLKFSFFHDTLTGIVKYKSSTFQPQNLKQFKSSQTQKKLPDLFIKTISVFI